MSCHSVDVADVVDVRTTTFGSVKVRILNIADAKESTDDDNGHYQHHRYHHHHQAVHKFTVHFGFLHSYQITSAFAVVMETLITHTVLCLSVSLH